MPAELKQPLRFHLQNSPEWTAATFNAAEAHVSADTQDILTRAGCSVHSLGKNVLKCVRIDAGTKLVRITRILMRIRLV